MTTNTTAGAPALRTADRTLCDPRSAVTRSLLGYGPLAGSLYLVSGLVQALTRNGFDITRHDLSLLANGPLGWIQIATLVLAGLMSVAAAVGVHRALAGGPGARWGAGLLAGYGVALVAAGAFVADPMDGFPICTPAGAPAQVTTAGVLHMTAGGIGFLCLVASTWVLARRFHAEGRSGWSRGSVAAGIVVLAGFLGVASGTTSPWAVLGLWVGVVTGWVWIAAVSIHLYSRTPSPAR
jgi:hypothetical protein